MTMQPDQLRELRKSLNWTQADMATAMGISRKAVNEMEGREEPIDRRTELAARFLAGSVGRPSPLLVERGATAAWGELLSQSGAHLRIDAQDNQIMGIVDMDAVVQAAFRAMNATLSEQP